jgi:hypothetical protein
MQWVREREARAMSKRTREVGRRRWLGRLLLGLLCFVWPLSRWHELTTTHEVCAEHGEVLDVGSSLEQELGDEPILVERDESDHDPCAFAPLAQPNEAGGGAPRIVAEPVLVGLGAGRPETPRAEIFPRYLLAPKQSPPIGFSS